MTTSNSTSILLESKTRPCLRNIFITVAFIVGVYFIGSALLANNSIKISPWGEMNDTVRNRESNACKNRCRPLGSEELPEGIVAKTSNLQMRPLWDSTADNNKSKRSANLLAIAAGLKQKEIVNKIVEKFLANAFVVMIFHYDGIVDGWSDLRWNNRVIHVSAMNQTKWWFAKRFLHPDIVDEYDYIFLWDEDLGVENFHPGRYISIVKDEGLEISQPALDPTKSDVHYQIAVRMKNSKVHRRFYKFKGGGRCDINSTGPPCTGWVEMMAPVFSRAAWRCAWYMIQNDLIHAWGLDLRLGYCAQGDRTKNVGVVDSEYIVHLNLPTLGGALNRSKESSVVHGVDNRPKVRMRSFIEMQEFKKRWNGAVKDDKCWIDPYQQQQQQTPV